MGFKIVAMALLSSLLAGATSCERRQEPTAVPMDMEALMEFNKQRVQNEQVLIDEWVARSGWHMERSKTGLRYEVYAPAGGDSVKSAEVVGVTYTAYLLDSTVVTQTGKTVQWIKIGHDDVITGLHELVVLLSKGDSVRVVFPSYLAYGLTGNSPTVPSNAPLLYDLVVVDLE
jgi:FKBP-type peptidyl-prolyl cis-trans isomerase